MPDFRFVGQTASGREVQGVVTANRVSAAKQKIRQLSERHRVKVQRIQKRRTFIYKIQKEGEKPLKGEQKAFTREEVRAALEKLGYRIISIQPKLFNLQLKPPVAEIVTFVRVSADLLRQKLPFNEILQLLINDVQNATLRDSLREINNDLRQGKDSEEAFMKQEKVLGRFTARMLGLGSKSGNMADIYESTAKFLERKMEFRRNLKSALIMPFFTLLVLIGAIVFYIIKIFPDTVELIQQFGSDLPPMTAAMMDVSNFLSAYILLFTILFSALSVGLAYFILLTPKGQFFKDKVLIKIPVLGSLIHKTTIEIFCRVFHALYSGSGENIEAIKLAAEACGNKYVEHQIKSVSIPMMLNQGKGLVKAFEASRVFTRTSLARFNSGAETGTVKHTARQIADYYEKETVYKLKNAVEFVQLFIAMVITIVITGLTLLSSEAALVRPKSFF